ncbi:MAG: tetratricopeptide repeat protein [Candidatus Daviesbacteria bacterium]|nr:tetratricopeptide repeat protein [Candidatus Daviesbacteria bacterium]
MADTSLPSAQNIAPLAIDAALEGRWNEALKLNTQIIKVEPENVDALNRLARAHFELGNFNQAQKYYALALKSDPYNPISQKNLKILKSFKKGSIQKPINNGIDHPQVKISPSLFLQEPGKTKVVSLLKAAEPQRLSTVYCGMPVEMAIKNRGITVLDQNGKYLGVLPDDLSYQIIRLIKGGNEYQAFIKSVRVNGLAILIRETFRSKRFRNQPSFLDSHAASNSDILSNFGNPELEDTESEASEDSEENTFKD